VFAAAAAMCEDDDSAWRAATATATTTTSPAAAAAASAAAGAAALRRIASCVSPQDKLRQLRAALDTLTDGDQVDADGLVERVVAALRCPQPPPTEPPPTATPPSPAAVDVTAAMTEVPLWHAECTFIENTLRAGDWSVGAESYALTTLLQVPYSAVLHLPCVSIHISHPCVLHSRHCMRLEPCTPSPKAASAVAVRPTT